MSSNWHNLKFVFDFESINRRISLQIASMMFLHDFGDGFDIALNNMKQFWLMILALWQWWSRRSSGRSQYCHRSRQIWTRVTCCKGNPVPELINCQHGNLMHLTCKMTSCPSMCLFAHACVVDHPTVAEFCFSLIFFIIFYAFSPKNKEKEKKLKFKTLGKGDKFLIL